MFNRPMLKDATQHRYTVRNLCSNPLTCTSSFPQTYNAKLRQQVKDAGSQDDIRHVYEHLYARVHAREDYTVYWYESLGTLYCNMCVSFGLNSLSYTPIMINYLSHQFAVQSTCPWGCCNIFPTVYVTYKGSWRKMPEILNFLILMPFGSLMCVLHDAKTKQGKKLLHSHVMSNTRKHNTREEIKFVNFKTFSWKKNYKCDLTCSSPRPFIHRWKLTMYFKFNDSLKYYSKNFFML